MTDEPMLPASRRLAIYRQVERDGGATVRQLVATLGVSTGTIRRDITTLHNQGLVLRVHGGAMRKQSATLTAARDSIAAKAACFAYQGAVVALSSGDISASVARHLTDIARLTAVTYSLPVAQAFQHHQRTGQTLLLTGGMLKSDQGLHGPISVGTLRSVPIDIGFIHIDGMAPGTGLTNIEASVAELNRAIMAVASQVIFYADHTAWHRNGHLVTALDQHTTLLVDPNLAIPARDELALTGATVIVAPVSDPRTPHL